MSARKESALNFLKLASSGRVKEAYQKYISPDFIHHNAFFKGDRQSLLMAMEEAHGMSPNKIFETKKVFEDGDTVITYSRVVKMDRKEIAVTHMFRFEKEWIVELWDVGMLIPENSPNQFGAF